jgi:hypothetical protein
MTVKVLTQIFDTSESRERGREKEERFLGSLEMTTTFGFGGAVLFCGKNHGALDDVFEFADVARPVVWRICR